LVRIAWRVNHNCYALHKNPENWVKLVCVAWRSGAYRQAVPLQVPRNKPQRMCRLAAMNSPPGDFWKFPETQKNTNNTIEMHTIHIKHYTIHAHT